MVDITTAKYKRRAKRLRELCDEFGLVIGDSSYSGNEDISTYFPADSEGNVLADWQDHVGIVEPPEQDIRLWAAITGSGEFSYIYPEYDFRTDATRRATRHIGDSIYSEYPVCVVNLDTGRRYKPRFETLVWKADA